MYASRVFRLCACLGVIGIHSVPSLADVVTITNGQETVTLEVSSSLDLDLEDIVAMTDADLAEWWTTEMSPELQSIDQLADLLLEQIEGIEERVDDSYNWIGSVLSHGTIDPDSRALLVDAQDSVDQIRGITSYMYDDITTITNLSNYLRGYYEDAMNGYGSDMTVFYGGTLSVNPSPGESSFCGCAEYLETLIDIATNINATIAYNGTLISNLMVRVNYWGSTYSSKINSIESTLWNIWLFLTEVDNQLWDIGFWDYDWWQLSEIDSWRWTAMDSIDAQYGFGTTALRFASWIMSEHVNGVTNVVDASGNRVPLLVELSNTNAMHFPLAMAVTNAYDDAGHMIPLYVTETNNLTAFTEMEAQADAMTASDMEPSGVWERFPTGVDFDHVGSLPMSTFVEDSLPSSVQLFSGYQFGESIVPTTFWNLGEMDSRVLRNIHSVTRSGWMFLGYVFVVIPVFWWTFMLGFRASVFVWAILDGRDAVKWFTDFVLDPAKAVSKE